MQLNAEHPLISKWGRIFLAAPLLLFIFFSACTKDRPSSFQAQIPSYFPALKYKSHLKEYTSGRFELGKKLFFDPILSTDHTTSCNSCHSQTHGFADHNVRFSKGIYGRKGVRNTPGITNLIWYPAFGWDGGVNHIEIFHLGPLTNELEMGTDMSGVLNRLNHNETYRELFKQNYGVEKISDYELFKALTLYIAQIQSFQTKYDQYRQGKTSFSEEEKKGYMLFKNYCASCHQEPLFTDFTYHNNGLDTIFADGGRGKITKEITDYGKFRVPSLRNVALTYPYMHDGRFWNLEEVLDHYSYGVLSNSQNLSPVLKQGISLNPIERKYIIAFLMTLTDYELLGDPKFY
jgi:cytochrome c peroxidase